jgi:hypothetical protein
MSRETIEIGTGTPVIDAEGLEIGIVSAVEDGTALLDPDPSLIDELRSLLGFGRAEPDHVALPGDCIDAIEEGVVRLSVPRRLL